MPLGSLFKKADLYKASSNNKENGWFENCCKVPAAMTITPPLPADYEAWIHRCGWVLYVHKPTKQRSWMHPVKLANFEARGLVGPGEYGPEMWIFEKNVNRGGFYCVDYGYPPFGWIRSALSPGYTDFKVFDRIGFDEWNRRQWGEDTTSAANKTDAARDGNVEFGAVVNNDDPENLATKFKDLEWRKKYSEVKTRVMKEQGVGPTDEELTERYRDRIKAKHGEIE